MLRCAPPGDQTLNQRDRVLPEGAAQAGVVQVHPLVEQDAGGVGDQSVDRGVPVAVDVLGDHHRVRQVGQGGEGR